MSGSVLCPVSPGTPPIPFSCLSTSQQAWTRTETLPGGRQTFSSMTVQVQSCTRAVPSGDDFFGSNIGPGAVTVPMFEDGPMPSTELPVLGHEHGAAGADSNLGEDSSSVAMTKDFEVYNDGDESPQTPDQEPSFMPLVISTYTPIQPVPALALSTLAEQDEEDKESDDISLRRPSKTRPGYLNSTRSSETRSRTTSLQRAQFDQSRHAERGGRKPTDPIWKPSGGPGVRSSLPTPRKLQLVRTEESRELVNPRDVRGFMERNARMAEKKKMAQLRLDEKKMKETIQETAFVAQLEKKMREKHSRYQKMKVKTKNGQEQDLESVEDEKHSGLDCQRRKKNDIRTPSKSTPPPTRHSDEKMETEDSAPDSGIFEGNVSLRRPESYERRQACTEPRSNNYHGLDQVELEDFCEEKEPPAYLNEHHSYDVAITNAWSSTSNGRTPSNKPKLTQQAATSSSKGTVVAPYPTQQGAVLVQTVTRSPYFEHPSPDGSVLVQQGLTYSTQAAVHAPQGTKLGAMLVANGKPHPNFSQTAPVAADTSSRIVQGRSMLKPARPSMPFSGGSPLWTDFRTTSSPLPPQPRQPMHRQQLTQQMLPRTQLLQQPQFGLSAPQTRLRLMSM